MQPYSMPGCPETGDATALIYTNDICSICQGNIVIDDDPHWKGSPPYPRKVCLQGGHEPAIGYRQAGPVPGLEIADAAAPPADPQLPGWLYSQDTVLNADFAARQLEDLLRQGPQR